MVITENPKENTATGIYNLNRPLHYSVQEPAKFHSQQFLTSIVVTYQKGKPRFQCPGQRAHNHIRPVGYQISHGHSHCIKSVFQLLDQVFLITTIITEKNNLSSRLLLYVSNVEEVTNIVPQPKLALFYRKLFAQNNYAISTVTLSWFIIEFSNMFFLKFNIFVLLFYYNFFLEVNRSLPLGPVDSFLLSSCQNTPVFFSNVLGYLTQIRHRIYPESKTHATVCPAVKVRGESKIGVTSQTNSIKAFFCQSHCPVDPFGCFIMRWSVARAIHQVQRLQSVCKRDKQRMVSPDTIIGKPHTLLALPRSRRHSPIYIQNSFSTLRSAHAFVPHLLPNGVHRIHQRYYIGFVKTSGEVSGCCRIRYPFRTQCIHIRFVITKKLNIIQTSAACQRIVGYVQNMIRFMIRQMYFHTMNSSINSINQTAVACQNVKCSNPSAVNCSNPVCHFILNILGAEHWMGLRFPLSAFKRFFP